MTNRYGTQQPLCLGMSAELVTLAGCLASELFKTHVSMSICAGRLLSHLTYYEKRISEASTEKDRGPTTSSM